MSDIREDGSEVLHYDEPDFTVFCRNNWIPANCNFVDMSIHWHDDIELIYITEGMIRHRINNKLITLHKGEGLFINSRQLHLLISDNSECQLYCLIFKPMILCSSKYVEDRYVTPVIRDNNLPYIHLSETVGWQNEILQKIAGICELSEKKGNELSMLSGLSEMWRVLSDNVLKIDYSDMSDNISSNQMKDMIVYIQNNYDSDITLDDICRIGNVGKTKCTELFKDYSNMTPMEYARAYRLEKSLPLLRDSDKSIAEIAYTVGFSGASYFSEYFKKTFRCTPLAYRKYERNHE